MKAHISRLELVNLIGKVQSIVPSKPAIPVLANILLEAKGGRLTLSATDLTVSIKARMEANTQEEGAITLPARRFFGLVRELTSDQVEIACGEDEIVHITAGSSHFRINGMHQSEFPALPNVDEGSELDIKGSFLKDMLSKSAFAAARDDSRHVLNGVLMEVKEEKSTFIGTDGKRLAKVHSPVEFVSIQDRQFLLPLKAVEEMIKMLGNGTDAKLILMDERLALEVDQVCLITKLLSGQYPDVERVIPQRDESSRISLHREELMTLLKQVSLFTSEMSNSVKFIFSDGELKLESSSSDIGEGKVSMPVDYHSEVIEIAFNPGYFIDILKHCRDETVSFSVTDSYNPGLITDSSSALFVIMPMRLTGE